MACRGVAARELEKNFHRHQGVSQVMVDALGKDAVAGEAVADDEVAHHRGFLGEKLLALGAEDESVHRGAEGGQEGVGIPGLVDVLVDRAVVDRGHRGGDVGIRGREDARDGRVFFAEPGKEGGALHPAEPLIGNDDGNPVGILLDRCPAFLRAGGGEDVEFLADDFLEILQGQFFIVHIENLAAGGR